MLGAAKLRRNKGRSPSGVNVWGDLCLLMRNQWRSPGFRGGWMWHWVRTGVGCDIHSLGQSSTARVLPSIISCSEASAAGGCDPNSCWSSGKFSSAYREVPVGLEGSFALLGYPALVSISGHSKCVKAMAKAGAAGEGAVRGSREQEHQRRRSEAGRQPGRAAFAALRLCAEGEAETAGRGQQTGISILMGAG